MLEEDIKEDVDDWVYKDFRRIDTLSKVLVEDVNDSIVNEKEDVDKWLLWLSMRKSTTRWVAKQRRNLVTLRMSTQMKEEVDNLN